MNKYDMPIEQWVRLQEKSKQFYGVKWKFLKVARENGLRADQIESVLDQLLDERMKRYAKFFKKDGGDETRSAQDTDGTSAPGGSE